MTITTAFETIAAEDFTPGYRYWPVNAGFESNWTIVSVDIAPADCEVFRNGEWTRPEMVTVTRRDGNVRTFEKGEQVAVQGPWLMGLTDTETKANQVKAAWARFWSNDITWADAHTQYEADMAAINAGTFNPAA